MEFLKTMYPYSKAIILLFAGKHSFLAARDAVNFRQLVYSLAIFMALIIFPALGCSQNDIIKAFSDSYVLENKGDFKGAAERMKKVFQADSYEINLRLGWLTYKGGVLTESVSYYSKAVSLKPYAIEPKLGLVLPLSAQGKWGEVINLYLKILEIDPQHSLVNYRLGLIYYNQGNFVKADPYIEKVVNLYPFDYDALLLFAWNKLKLQKTREAKVLFQKVLMYSPEDSSAQEGLKLIR